MTRRDRAALVWCLELLRARRLWAAIETLKLARLGDLIDALADADAVEIWRLGNPLDSVAAWQAAHEALRNRAVALVPCSEPVRWSAELSR